MASSGDKGEAFSFTSDTLDNILKEIKRPGIKKSTQESDMLTKIIKHFPSLIFLTEGIFLNDFKKTVVNHTRKNHTHVHKEGQTSEFLFGIY